MNYGRKKQKLKERTLHTIKMGSIIRYDVNPFAKPSIVLKITGQTPYKVQAQKVAGDRNFLE